MHGHFKAFNGSNISLCFKTYREFTTSSPAGGIYGYLASAFVAGGAFATRRSTTDC